MSILPPNSGETLILCATSRLAQHMRARAPEGAGRVWQTPRALTTSQWLGAAAEEAFLAGLLPDVIEIAGEAAMVAWETVIATHLPGAGAELFDRQGLAAAQRDADALCVTWNIDPGRQPGSDETRFFIQTREAFIRHCRAKGWIDTARLHRMVLDCLADGRLQMPSSLHLAGFDRLSPLEQRLVEICRQSDIPLTSDDPSGQPSADQVDAVECDDIVAECQAVADWVARELAGRPQARIGVVAPDLAAVRGALSTALDVRLHPQWVRPAATETPRCYNFSLGDPLAAVPLVRCALDWLAVAVNPADIELTALSKLLRSPYWNSLAEADALALADATARRRLGFRTSLDTLRQFLERHGAMAAARSLARFAEQLANTRGRQMPSRWGGCFLDWLVALGWPGDRNLSSHEYQARQAFQETMAKLATLDEALGPVAASEALARLVRIARERVFQPQASGTARVQILGILESAGLEFDSLWVMGMNDHVWPPAPRPNPFLPAALQRALGTPHASAEVELQFARNVHRRLLRAAPRVRFSYSRLDGERMLRPSPLLAGIAAGQVPSAAPVLVPAPVPANRLERLADWQAPPVRSDETVAGGSGLLKAQAICPAWGFYAYRLGAKALESPVEGLDARDRGSLVHAVLECFWKATVESSRLAAFSPTERGAAIASAVEAGLAAFESARRASLPPRFRASEARRLERLLDRWLRLESEREVPFTVVACEQEATVTLCGLPLKVVVDRIDRFADGRSVVIDYKTGRSVDTRNWTRSRLSEPQLPLYVCELAATLPEMGDPAGAVFAKVHADETRFYGVTADSGLLPGVAGIADSRQRLFDRTEFPDWTSVLRHWEQALATVAAEVRDGVASVSFADEADLQYCDVRPLLRLPERARQIAERQGGGA